MRKKKQKTIKKIPMGKLITKTIRGIALVYTIAALLVGLGLYAFTLVQESTQTMHSLTSIVAANVDVEDVIAVREAIEKINAEIPAFEGPADDAEFDYTSWFGSIPCMPEFQRVLEVLNPVQTAVSRVESVYLSYIDYTRNRMVYMIDSSMDPSDVCLPGTFEDLTGMRTTVDGVVSLDATISIDKTGLFIYGGDALLDKDGQVVCNIGVDMNLQFLFSRLGIFALQLMAILLIMTLIIHAVSIHYAKKSLQPIEEITAVADRFTENFQKQDALPAEGIYKNVDGGFIVEFNKLVTALQTLEDGLHNYMDQLNAATRERERISTELTLATAIQLHMLPNIFPPFPERAEFDLYASMDPAKEVGGDFYDFFMVDSDHLALLIADVSGKGVPAALFMMATKIMLNDRTMLGVSPSEILAAVNDQLSRNNVMEMFVTVWLGILEIPTGKLVASNAGHEFPVIARSGGAFELIKDRHGFVLGGMPEMVYQNYTIDLKPGDRLFLYTDGVPEANNERGDRLGVDQMLNVLNRCTDSSPEKLLKTMTEGIREFVAGAEQFDDITMLSLTYYGTENDDGLTLDATIPNWETVSAFLEEKLDKMDAPVKAASQVMLAVEELYANVASYAYEGRTGKVTVKVTPSESGNGVAVKLTDSGIPYDPLQKEDPDIGLDAADRPIGGLGVFLVKKTMDDVAYERKDSKNIVVITKTWQTE